MSALLCWRQAFRPRTLYWRFTVARIGGNEPSPFVRHGPPPPAVGSAVLPTEPSRHRRGEPGGRARAVVVGAEERFAHLTRRARGVRTGGGRPHDYNAIDGTTTVGTWPCSTVRTRRSHPTRVAPTAATILGNSANLGPASPGSNSPSAARARSHAASCSVAVHVSPIATSTAATWTVLSSADTRTGSGTHVLSSAAGAHLYNLAGRARDLEPRDGDARVMQSGRGRW